MRESWRETPLDLPDFVNMPLLSLKEEQKMKQRFKEDEWIRDRLRLALYDIYTEDIRLRKEEAGGKQ